jgi:hypothetical protein
MKPQARERHVSRGNRCIQLGENQSQTLDVVVSNSLCLAVSKKP